jgi:hypothetical protein
MQNQVNRLSYLIGSFWQYLDQDPLVEGAIDVDAVFVNFPKLITPPVLTLEVKPLTLRYAKPSQSPINLIGSFWQYLGQDPLVEGAIDVDAVFVNFPKLIPPPQLLCLAFYIMCATCAAYFVSDSPRGGDSVNHMLEE